MAIWVTIRSAAPSPPATVSVLVAGHDLPAGHTLTAGDLRSRPWPASAAPVGLLKDAAGQVLATPLRTGELLTDVRVIGPGLLAGQPPGTVAVPIRLGDPSASAFVRAGDRVDVLVSSTSGWASQSGGAGSAETPGGTASSGEATTDPKDSGLLDANQSGLPRTSSTGSGSGAERVATDALVLAAGSGSGSAGDGGGGTGLGGFGGGDLTGDPGPATEGTAGVIVLAVSSYEAARLTAAQTGTFVAIAVLPRN